MFDKLPEWAKIALAVVAVVVVLAVLAPIIKFLVDMLIGVLIAVAVLGGGYLILTKTGILK